MKAYKIGSLNRTWTADGSLDYKGGGFSLESAAQLPKNIGEAAMVTFGRRNAAGVYKTIAVKLTRIR